MINTSKGKGELTNLMQSKFWELKKEELRSWKKMKQEGKVLKTPGCSTCQKWNSLLLGLKDYEVYSSRLVLQASALKWYPGGTGVVRDLDLLIMYHHT